MSTEKLKLIITELSFIRELFGAGVTQIGQANNANRGRYFQSLSNLSIGLERVGKICYIIDFSLKNKGLYPEYKDIKAIGHDLNTLYLHSKVIISSNSFKLDFLKDLEQPIQKNILSLLTNFSKGDRYHNIDLLLDPKQKESPIYIWKREVDDYILNKYISERRKELIISDSSFVVAPYRRLLILQIIRYWQEILINLNNKNYEKGFTEDIPDISEHLGLFYNTDKYFKSRKTWDKLI